MLNANVAIWAIATLVTAGVLLRPWKLPEAVWAVVGALALLAFGLLPLNAVLSGVVKGMDVYLFLTGMMLLAELARQEELFEWLAAHAAKHARGSATRLFTLVYVVGILVTVFLSNDATAVVLTPAVAAVARAAKVHQPLPYLLICAFIANAASFVLPISNPANLVIYGHQMPPLLVWLSRFALPSLLSIGATYWLLRFTQRKALRQSVSCDLQVRALSASGKAAAAGILATAAILMFASAANWDLGWPTLVAGAATLAAVSLTVRSGPWRFLSKVSWSVIPLVAGLFVLVEALGRTGAIDALCDYWRDQAARSVEFAAASSGISIAFVSNFINNLPAGLIAGTALQDAALQGTAFPSSLSSAVLIGVDLGPNLSVTGSLATILWLTALRRDGFDVKSRDFLKLGLVIMPPALMLALSALLLH